MIRRVLVALVVASGLALSLPASTAASSSWEPCWVIWAHIEAGEYWLAHTDPANTAELNYWSQYIDDHWLMAAEHGC